MDDKVSLRFVHNSEFSCYLLTLTAKAKEADNSNERVWKDANSVFQLRFYWRRWGQQGLYQRNDIRRMFIKSGNDKWKEKKYFFPFVSVPARFRWFFSISWNYTKRTFPLLPLWSKQGLILLHNLQKWKFDFPLSFELDYSNKLRTDWDRIT